MGDCQRGIKSKYHHFAIQISLLLNALSPSPCLVGAHCPLDPIPLGFSAISSGAVTQDNNSISTRASAAILDLGYLFSIFNLFFLQPLHRGTVPQARTLGGMICEDSMQSFPKTALASHSASTWQGGDIASTIAIYLQLPHRLHP